MTRNAWLYLLTSVIALADVGFFSGIDVLGDGFLTFTWLVSIFLFMEEVYFFRLVLFASLLTEVFSFYPLGWHTLAFSVLYATYLLARRLIQKHPKLEIIFFLLIFSGFRLVLSAFPPLPVFAFPKALSATFISLPFYFFCRLVFVFLLKRFFGPSYLQLKLYSGGEIRV